MVKVPEEDANALIGCSGYGRTWSTVKNAGWNRWKGWCLVEGIDPLAGTSSDVARFVREYEGLTRALAKDACAAIGCVYAQLSIPRITKGKEIADAKRGLPESVRKRKRETPYMRRWLERFILWCDLYGVCSLPANPDDVKKFLLQLERGYMRPTVIDVACMIGVHHTDNGYPDPREINSLQTALKAMKGRNIEGDGRRLESLSGMTSQAQWFEWCLERGIAREDASPDAFCDFLAEVQRDYAGQDLRLRFVMELYRGVIPGGSLVKRVLREFLESSLRSDVMVESEVAAKVARLEPVRLTWDWDAGLSGRLTDVDRARIDGFMEASVPPTTYAQFQRVWEVFKSWCAMKSIEEPKKALPSEVCAFLALKAARLDASSVRSFRDALAWWFSFFRPDDNPARDPMVKKLIQGVLNTTGKPSKQMSPIRQPDYELVAAGAFEPRGGETRDRALLRGAVDVVAIGFLRDGLLRGGEGAAALWKHLEPQSDGAGVLLIPRSKNDREGKGAVVGISCQTMDSLYYMRDIRRVLQPERAKRPEIFTLQVGNLGSHIKDACEWAGLVGNYRTHSCRIGMCQDLASAGFTDLQIAAAGRWKNPRMVAYYIRNIALADGAVAQWYARGAGAVLVVDGKLRGYLEYLEDGGGPFGIGKKSTQFGM